MQCINRIKAISLYILVSLFLVFEMGVQVSPSIMTNQLQSSLGLGALGLGFMSSVYFYSYTLMQIPAGIFFDKFKLNKVIFFSLAVCATGTLIFSMAGTAFEAGFARVLMGLGSAFAFISVLVLARDLFSKRRFALLTGITQMLAAVGAMGGSYPLEALVSHFGWRQSMLLLAIIGYVLAVLILIFVRYCDCKISDGNSLKELLSGAGKLIKTRSTWAIALYACSLWAPMSAFASLWGVRFLQHVYHISHSLAALSITFMWIGLAAGSPIVGALSELFATRKKILISCALLGLVSFSLVFFHVSKSYWLMCVFIFFAGFACAGQALSFAVVRDRKIAKDKLGAAIGINNMAVVISGAIFQPLVGWLIGLYHQQGLIVIAGVYLLGLLVAVVLVKETLVLNRELR